MKSLSPPQDFK